MVPGAFLDDSDHFNHHRFPSQRLSAPQCRTLTAVRQNPAPCRWAQADASVAPPCWPGPYARLAGSARTPLRALSIYPPARLPRMPSHSCSGSFQMASRTPPLIRTRGSQPMQSAAALHPRRSFRQASANCLLMAGGPQSSARYW